MDEQLDQFHQEAGEVGIPDPREAHAPHKEHPSAKEYVRIGIVLAALTAIEVWLSYSGLEGAVLIALLLGAAFLFIKRYITWHIPITFILTVGLATWAFGGKEGLFSGDAIFHMMAGGLVLGAFYMATDYVTGPSVRSAQIVFGVACGLLTALIRLKGGYPEGVMFAILIMNCFAPLLDRGMRSRVFGKAEAKGVKK